MDDTPAQFALGLVRVHRWTTGTSAPPPPPSPLERELDPDRVDFFRWDGPASALTSADLLVCGRLLCASLVSAPSVTASALKSAALLDSDEEEADDDEEEEIFNRDVDALGFREPSIARSLQSTRAPDKGAASASGEDGIFFHLPKDHPKFLTLQGVGVADPRFRRAFYVQQEVPFLVLLSNVPFQAYLREKLQELACEFFAQGDGDDEEGRLGDVDALEAFYRGLCGSSINFTELPYREIHAGLPIVRIVKRFGKDIVAILRVLLLEGRVVCYSANPGLASSATLALLALLPGALSVNAEFTSRTIQAVVYRLRRFGLPFSLFNEDFTLQPCLTSDQEPQIFGTAGFLVGTSNPLLLKRPSANLDLIVDLDTSHVVSYPTMRCEYAFAFGPATAAFADSLAERLGRNVGSIPRQPSPPPAKKGGPRLLRRRSTPTIGHETAHADVDWVLEQFQMYFEHFLSEAFKGPFAPESTTTTADDGASSDPYNPSLRSRLVDLAAPAFGQHAAFYADYGRGWSHAWQRTSNHENWLSAHRLERRRSTIITGAPPPQEGRAVYTYPNGDEYDGEFHQGRRHGFGVYVEFATKNQYEGDWVDDRRHGKGILCSKANGYIYDGEWVDDQRTGHGHSSLRNVETYTGGWLANRFHGLGVYSNASGDVYDGEWREGLKHGLGKWTTAHPKADDEFGGMAQFVGEWRGDRFHGTGSVRYGDGTEYAGTFHEGKRHGNGILVLANGDRYDGQWWKGYKHGEGSLFSAASGITREGTWRKDTEVDGRWFVVYPNGDKYTGECRRGRPWGEGICKYQDGSLYSGTWVDGLREGHGMLVQADGTQLEGEWRNSAFAKAVRGPSRMVVIPLTGSSDASEMWDPLSGTAATSSSSPRRRSTIETTRSPSLPPASGTHEFVYPNGDRYEGEFLDHQRHGFGVFTERATGNVYEGDWRHDRRHGSGVFTSGMKDFIYDGSWADDLRCGVGHCVIRGCETYSGHWSANQFHGLGKYIDAEGTVYEGEFAHGRKHGVGKQVTTAPSKEQYSGEWRDGQRHGLGDAVFADGATYSGSWRQDLREGEGTFVAANGEKFTGQWRQGLREGAGIWQSPATGVVKEGVWVNDEPVDGEWTIQFPDGSKFTGQCVKGRPHGRGVCKYANGDLYDGHWVQGKRHGQGTGFFGNGESFIGEWENNHVALNGRGRLTLADGTVHVYAK